MIVKDILKVIPKETFVYIEEEEPIINNGHIGNRNELTYPNLTSFNDEYCLNREVVKITVLDKSFYLNNALLIVVKPKDTYKKAFDNKIKVFENDLFSIYSWVTEDKTISIKVLNKPIGVVNVYSDKSPEAIFGFIPYVLNNIYNPRYFNCSISIDCVQIKYNDGDNSFSFKIPTK